MILSYDTIAGAFLGKIAEFDLMELSDEHRTEVVDGYMKRAVSAFRKNCLYDLFTTQDDEARLFDVEIEDEDVDELVDIISEGMVYQWIKQYLYRQEVLENAMNTRDFTTYSPATLLMRLGEAHETVKNRYTQMIREYSYNHGNLKELHM